MNSPPLTSCFSLQKIVLINISFVLVIMWLTLLDVFPQWSHSLGVFFCVGNAENVIMFKLGVILSNKRYYLIVPFFDCRTDKSLKRNIVFQF